VALNSSDKGSDSHFFASEWFLLFLPCFPHFRITSVFLLRTCALSFSTSLFTSS